MSSATDKSSEMEEENGHEVQDCVINDFGENVFGALWHRKRTNRGDLRENGREIQRH